LFAAIEQRNNQQHGHASETSEFMIKSITAWTGPQRNVRANILKFALTFFAAGADERLAVCFPVLNSCHNCETFLRLGRPFLIGP